MKDIKDADPELLKTFDKLGISLTEQKKLTNVAIDAVFDSVSIGTTYQEELESYGIIFCSMSEAVKKHSQLLEKYLGSARIAQPQTHTPVQYTWLG